MYLRTPKRYSPKGRKRSFISLRWIWLWLLTPAVVFAGIQIYNLRDQLGPPLQESIMDVVDDARNSISTAVAPTPLPTVNPAQRIDVAESAWDRGAIEEALDEYQALMLALPNDVEVHYRVTLGLLMEGQDQAALDAAERTVTANPFDSNAWAIRALAMEENGRYGEAIASGLRALELDPENARAMAFLAETYLDVGQGDRALETVNQAIDLNPDSFEAYRVRGRIMQESLFDVESARSDFQRAYDLAPNIPYPAIDLVALDLVLQNYDQGLETLRAILELNPRNTQALFWMGNYYYRGYGDPNRAADYLLRCVDNNPESISCLYLLGRVQIALLQYDEAVDSLTKAIDLGSTDPFHYYWAGRAHYIQGDCSAALIYWQPGYILAQQSENESLIATYEEDLRDCGALAPLPEVTPDPNATPEEGSNTTEGEDNVETNA